MAFSLREKIKRALGKIKAKFPKLRKKDKVIIDKEIDKQADIINNDVVDKIEELQKQIDDLRKISKKQDNVNMELKKSLTRQPVKALTDDVIKIGIKDIKKRKFRKFRSNTYRLTIIYSWRAGYYPPVNDVGEDYWEFEREDNIEVNILIRAKNTNRAIEKAIKETQQYEVIARKKLDEISNNPENRVYIHELDHQSALLYNKNGTYIYDVHALINWTERK